MLTFTTLWANLADNKLIFFPENRIGFMQTVSTGENLHEMSNPISCKIIIKKYFKLSSAENFTQSAKR